MCFGLVNTIKAIYILLSKEWHLDRFQSCIHDYPLGFGKIGSHEQSLGTMADVCLLWVQPSMSWLPLLSTGGAFLKCFVGGCPTVVALIPVKHTHTRTSSRFRLAFSYIYSVNISFYQL